MRHLILGTTLLALASLFCLAEPAAAQTYNARPGRNGLEGRYPVRGFGNSNQVDQWVPFTLLFGHRGQITGAKIRIVVRPINQLIGTDTLMLRGKSGRVYTMYSGFSSLPTSRWSTVDVDISHNADVLAAANAGHLAGCIQDDTAVFSVQLVVTRTAGAQPQQQVKIYDVYYWAMDRNSGRPAWFRYQSYFHAGDATRAIHYLRGLGYHTTWRERAWR